MVGAGGSIPYGYPSGTKLVEQMLHGLQNPLVPGSWAFPLLEIGYTTDQIHQFRAELSGSRRESVDAFLEKRSDHLELGKAAIAAVLLTYENADRGNLETGDWYRHLVNRVLQNFASGWDEKLTVITFNYDRSLDDYLYKAFKHSLRRDGDDLKTALGNLEIIHVHGSLCRLSWQAGETHARDYGENSRGDSIKAAASCIRIIHEQDEAHSDLKRAHAALRAAHRVCFLGFGYHPTNIRRLLAGDWHMKKEDDAIWGSAIGLTGGQCKQIESLFSDKLKTTGTDCLDTLRHHPRFLM